MNDSDNSTTTNTESKTNLESTKTGYSNLKKYMIKGIVCFKIYFKLIFFIIQFYLIFLVVILGDVNVGKSNIIRRVLGHDFQELEATVGVEFGLIDVKGVDPDDPDVVLSIQIWDTCNLIF